MIVEVIGSTGAGKTTLISRLRDRMADTAKVTTAFDLIAAPLGLRWVTHTTARNLIQECFGFPFLLLALFRYKELLSFTLRLLARQADFSIFTLNNFRSLVRKLGVYEAVRRQAHDRIVLVDEGTVLLAHILFVYSDANYTSQEIQRFASLIPLPDIVVYLRAPVDSLVKRSLQRPSPPREMKSKEVRLVEKYIHRAVSLFDCLVETETIRGRLLVVDGPDFNDPAYAALVDDLTAAILKEKTYAYAARTHPQMLS